MQKKGIISGAIVIKKCVFNKRIIDFLRFLNYSTKENFSNFNDVIMV